MLSIPHLIILFVVVLVVFGPHKLPELARSLGKLMAEFRKASTDFRYAFEEEMRNIERQARENEIKKAQEAATRAAESTPALPATLATAPESETASAAEAIDLEPVIRPNSEAVPRAESETYAPDGSAEEDRSVVPDSSLDAENSERPLHGQR